MTGRSAPESLRSMTGYAQARSEQDGWSLRVSLRSVNHRFLDLRVHIPEGLEVLEPQMRQLVRDHIQRGHVDLTLHIDASKSEGLQIDRKLAAGYLRAIEELRQEFNLAPEPQLAALLRLPGVVASPTSTGSLPAAFDDEELERLGAQVSACLKDALRKLDGMRQEEGRSLAREMSALLKSIGDKTARLEIVSEQSRPAYAQRLKVRLQELTGTVPIDPVRVAQEAPNGLTCPKNWHVCAAMWINSGDWSERPAKSERNWTFCSRKCNAKRIRCCRKRRGSARKDWI
jgi:uncharacterized protein (TIGR00255 family)